MTDGMTRRLMLLPGDGIGPEVCAEVRRVLEHMSRHRGLEFDVREDLIGGACYDAHGVALRDETVAECTRVDAVLLGAVGGPAYDDVPRQHRPEAGLLKIRKDLDLFANLRPALTFEALLEASTLKRSVIEGLDILIVRELTSGVYFGEPRGLEPGGERCVDTQAYTRGEIERVGRVAFELAAQRSGLLHSVDKANVMETGMFWRDVITRLHASYPKVRLEHMYADNCAMQLVRRPRQFDVLVTDNLFGDLLSDCASMCTGSLGMLPSASLGAKEPSTGKRPALYEPVHGSAPDIAGQGVANPLAMLLSLAMALRYSLDLEGEALALESAVQRALAQGYRTADIAQETSQKNTSQENANDERIVSTSAMGGAVCEALELVWQEC